MRALLLECGGLGLQHLCLALGGSSRTAAAATAATAAEAAAAAAAAAAATWSQPYVLKQVYLFSSAKPLRRQQARDELHQLIDEAYELMRPLACSRAFVERVFSKRFRLQPSSSLSLAAFPQELAARLTTLQDIAAAHTQQQRAALVRALWHCPPVLNLRPDTLRDKAAELAAYLLQQQGVTPQLVQQLMGSQPSVFMYKPETLAHKVSHTTQRLGVLPPVVLSMWLRQRSMISLSKDTLDAKMLELSAMLHLQDADLCKLVVSAPTLLASRLDVVASRFNNLLATLPSDVWTADALGAALLSCPSVLTYSEESVRHKWRVVSRYAVLHEPSWEQLQQRLQSRAVLVVFSRPDERIAMLEYIMQQPPLRQQEADGDAQANSSSSGDLDVISPEQLECNSSSSSSVDSSGARRKASSSSSGKPRGRPKLSLLVQGQAGLMPRLFCVLSPRKTKWDELQQQYPGFEGWYQQRREELRRQQQPRRHEEEELLLVGEGDEGKL